MIIQERFTQGEETRLQPERQKSDLWNLVNYKCQLIALTEVLKAKVTPTIYMEMRQQPEIAVHDPHVGRDLWYI